MSRQRIHKTAHLHRMAFIGETIYRSPNEHSLEPPEAKIQKGCRIAGAVLTAAEDPEEQDYLNDIITPAILGAAWQDAFVDDLPMGPNDLMYRVTYLPRLDLINERSGIADQAWEAGVKHVVSTGEDRPIIYTRIRIGREVLHLIRTHRAFPALTTGSLWLGAVQTARDIEAGRLSDKETIQDRVRQSGYDMTETAFRLGRKIGALPTVSQLNDPYSPLAVELMRTGPDHLRERYVEAVETIRETS